MTRRQAARARTLYNAWRRAAEPYMPFAAFGERLFRCPAWTGLSPAEQRSWKPRRAFTATVRRCGITITVERAV